MELFDAIASRSTAKGLTEPGPTAEQMEQLLQAAAHAPDHGRLKPWRFIAVNGAARESFANAVAEARRDQIPTFTDEQMEIERVKIRRSPSILVAGGRISPRCLKSSRSSPSARPWKICCWPRMI